MNKIISATALLMFSLGNVQAALVNYTITGDVVVGDEVGVNAFGLTAGDTITATGTFDDSVLSGGSGTIDFSSGGSVDNTMTIFVGTEIFTASNDTSYGTGAGPSIKLETLSLSDFDFLAFVGTNGAAANFSSSFTSFNDFNVLFGNWSEIEITAVPVPAAVWLFGSGLLGLVGVARRKTA